MDYQVNAALAAPYPILLDPLPIVKNSLFSNLVNCGKLTIFAKFFVSEHLRRMEHSIQGV